MAADLKLAITQMASAHDWTRNCDKAEALARDAARQGAQLVLLQELFDGDYFCIEQHVKFFAQAHELHSHPTVKRFAALAKELGVVLPVSVFERAGQAHYNTTVIVDADGSQLGFYRKSHIPDGRGYQEKFYFSPGDTGFKVWDTAVGRIGLGICWDQWFPEAARAMALMGAEVLLYPTAIGSEPPNPSYDSSHHWQNVMRGHAAANIMPLAASNRVAVRWHLMAGVTRSTGGRSFRTIRARRLPRWTGLKKAFASPVLILLPWASCGAAGACSATGGPSFMAICCQSMVNCVTPPFRERFCAKRQPQSAVTDRDTNSLGDLMKHLVIAGLLSAIGALALTPSAHAESQYCYDNPDDNRCEYDPDFRPRFRPPPPDFDEDGGWDGNPRYRQPRQDFGDYIPPRPPRDWGMDSRQRFCVMVGRSLREQGYRNVRATECGGSNFKYTAYKRGARYLIKVKARTGRIMYAIPN